VGGENGVRKLRFFVVVRLLAHKCIVNLCYSGVSAYSTLKAKAKNYVMSL